MILVRVVCTSEPYYYETAYGFDFKPMDTDSCGLCYYKDMKYVSGRTCGTWKCMAKCKALTQFEVDTVLEFKSSHCMMLCVCCPCDDGCPYTHPSKIIVILVRVMCSVKDTVYCDECKQV